jgi:transcription termination factor Rho
MPASMALRDLHLADLHQRARELGLPRYRMLTRDELIEAIEEHGGESGAPPKEVAAPAVATETEALPEEAGSDEEAAPDDQEEEEAAEEAEAEEVTGVLDRMPQGYGFLRLSGMSEAEGDVYVSASQIRRCELRPGDQVSGHGASATARSSGSRW